jgi:integrase
MRSKVLTARTAQTAPVGWHCDGRGLYLQCTAGTDGSVCRSWVFRYRAGSRERYMGLGPLADVSLAEAREKALDARKLRLEGLDPIEARKVQRTATRLEAAKAMTFQQCADAYIAAHRAGWRNDKHAGQWVTTLATYAGPIIGTLPVQAVDTTLVMKVIEPLWTTRSETASRLRGRIEAVLDWAKVRGYREGENPARWRGHLDHLLPAKSRVRKVEHHAALPYGELPAFLVELRGREGVGARALEFAILTAARAGEVLGMCWKEINLAEAIWTVPATRMKAGKEHRVPLSGRAVAILQEMQAHRGADAFVFPGGNMGKPLSNTAIWEVLKSMGREVTAHGFRSTFMDWAHEQTAFPKVVIDMALAHKVSDKVEAAYRRGDLFEKRRRLMAEWGKYCEKAPAISPTILAFRKST